MDDDYELISKDVIRKLREENQKLKDGEIEGAAKNNSVDLEEIGAKVVSIVKDEFAAENKMIVDSLTEIKDLNKSTLENLISKTQSLDTRLEKMIESMSGMVDSLNEVLDGISNQDEDKDSFVKEKIEKVSDTVSNLEKDMGGKLDEIELFMKNLRILLSYVKPADVVIDKKKFSNQQSNNQLNNDPVLQNGGNQNNFPNN